MDWFSQRSVAAPDPVRRRLMFGLAISVLVHGLILSLQLGLPGLGLPGLAVPWQKQPAERNPLQLRLSPSIAGNAVPAPVAEHTEESSRSLGLKLSDRLTTGLPVKAAVTGLQILAMAAPEKLEPKSALQNAHPATEKAAPSTLPDTTGKLRSASKAVRQPAAARRRQALPLNPELPDLIAVDSLHQDRFVVAQRDPSESRTILPDLDKRTDTVSDQAYIPEPVAQPQSSAGEAAETLTREVNSGEAVAEPATASAEMPARVERQNRSSLAAQQQRDSLLNQRLPDSRRLDEQLDSANRQQAQQAYQQLQVQEQQEAEQSAQRVTQQLAQHPIQLPATKVADIDEKAASEEVIAAVEQQKRADQLARRERLRQLQVSRQASEQQQNLNQQLQQSTVSDPGSQRAVDRLLSQRLEPGQVAATPGSLAAGAGKGSESKAIVSARQGGAGAANQKDTQSAGQTANAELDALFGKPVAANDDLASRARQQLQDSRRSALGMAVPQQSEARQRRYSVFGGFERDIQIRMYVEGWKQKIERNGNLNYSQTAYQQSRAEPIVTVVVRSDGSVEEIVIHRSSGRADLDQAVRNIVRLNAPYAAFPPQIAARYDVLEIRRIWSFEEHLKLLEELR